MLCAGSAYGNPAGDVPAGIDSGGSRIDAIGTVDYEYESQTSSIWREHVGEPTTMPGAPGIVVGSPTCSRQIDDVWLSYS